MSHSFTKLYIHYVFAPKSRFPVFASANRQELIKYIVGIAKNYDCFLHSGYIMPDHVHLLLQLPAKHSVAEIAKVIKGNTSRHINAEHQMKARFEWQEGYGAFSCSHSMLETVIAYISNQEEHHKKFSYTIEYQTLLEKHGIDVVTDIHTDEQTQGEEQNLQ